MRLPPTRLLWTLLSLLLAALTVRAQDETGTPELVLSDLIADGMVIQRNSESPIFGRTTPGSVVRAGGSWMLADVATTADPDGRFSLELPTPPAGGPHAIVVATDQGAEAIVRDVWSGEVWLASGQSNMEWTLGPGVGPGTNRWRDEVAAANFPLIRVFKVNHQTAWSPKTDGPTDSWAAITPENAASRSAVAYYFAKRLWTDLSVPIGIIESSWGGTPVEAWTSLEAQADDEALAASIERMREGALNPEADAESALERERAWWRDMELRDPGIQNRWMASRVDEAGWNRADVPTSFKTIGEGGYDGTIWFRHQFELTREEAKREYVLALGPIDDRDTTWVNGVRVGGMESDGQWQVHRNYDTPRGLLREGRNVVCVRAFDTGGAGGFFLDAESPFGLVSKEGQALSMRGEWRWRRGLSIFDAPPRPQIRWLNEDRPSALFSGMIAPYVGYGIAGFIWYQGESNRLNPVAYRERFGRLIRDWRQRWQRGDLPFYFVQIAPHRYGGDHGEASELREAQAMALALPNTGMAATTDIGDPDDIHPSDKQSVGDRLARLALARTYGQADVVDAGPELIGWMVEGSSLALAFGNAPGGIVFENGAPGPFYLAGEDRRFFPADDVVAVGNTVTLRSELVARPVAARFAWGAADAGNLANAAGLPAAPFRTDTWPSVTQDGPAFEPHQ